MTFDPVGFWLPATLAAAYLPRCLSVFRWRDYALTLLTTLGTFITVEPDQHRLIIGIPFYIFVLLYHAHCRRARRLPAGACMPAIYFSLVVPDVLGAQLYANGRPAVVGGAGFTDGLFVLTFGLFALYLLLCRLLPRSGVDEWDSASTVSFWRFHLTPRFGFSD